MEKYACIFFHAAFVRQKHEQAAKCLIYQAFQWIANVFRIAGIRHEEGTMRSMGGVLVTLAAKQRSNPWGIR